MMGGSGGWGRNRTGVHGFAGRCITTLPPSQGKRAFETEDEALPPPPTFARQGDYLEFRGVTTTVPPAKRASRQSLSPRGSPCGLLVSLSSFPAPHAFATVGNVKMIAFGKLGKESSTFGSGFSPRQRRLPEENRTLRCNLERETRLELATPTLARLCSTN